MSRFRICRRVMAFAVALVLAALGFISPHSRAEAQSLFSIPTAESLEKKKVTVNLEEDTGSRLRSPETLRLTSVRAGLTDRLTVGFDARLSDAFVVQPAFSLRLTRKDAPLAIKIGYENVGVRSFGQQPYIIGSHAWKNWKKTHLHLGLTHDQGRNYGMFGIEREVSSGLTLQADYISGSGDFLTVGVAKELGKNLTLTLGFIHANSRDDEDGVFLSAEYEFDLP